jgi:hypothetical protein
MRLILVAVGLPLLIITQSNALGYAIAVVAVVCLLFDLLPGSAQPRRRLRWLFGPEPLPNPKPRGKRMFDLLPGAK